MRTTFLALAIVISGISGNLQASSRPHSAIHKVRKGETAAKIARDCGITLRQLESLNPRISLDHLSVGAKLRVAEDKRAALPGKHAPGPLRAKAGNPAKPVAPLPGTPALGPATLVHLERILPAEGLTPAPARRTDARAGSVASNPPGVA